jgi:hypothetical protein
MKIKDLISKIDAFKPSDAWFSLGSLVEELGLTGTICNEEQDRMKGYYIHVWQCTDTWVGSIAWFLEGEFVYYTFQPARKSDITYHFTSKEAYDKVVEFVMSMLKQEISEPKYLDLEDEIPEKFTVEYNSQILHKYVWYKDQLVEVIKNHFQYNPYSRGYFDRVDILYEGIKISVNVNELQLDWGSPTKK